MDEETQKLIKEQYEKLPLEVKNAILAADLPDKLELIGKNQGLHVDQQGVLETEVMLVMLGLIHPEVFYDELKKRLGLPDEKIRATVQQANELILRPVREKLKQHYEKELQKEQIQRRVRGEAVPEVTPPEVTPPPTPAPRVSPPERVKEEPAEEEVLKTAGIEKIKPKKPEGLAPTPSAASREARFGGAETMPQKGWGLAAAEEELQQKEMEEAIKEVEPIEPTPPKVVDIKKERPGEEIYSPPSEAPTPEEAEAPTDIVGEKLKEEFKMPSEDPYREKID